MTTTKILNKSVSAVAVCVLSQVAFAGGSDIWFEPLTESAPVTDPNSLSELMGPWVTPEGIMQTNLLSLREVEDTVLSPLQSVVRAPLTSRHNTASMFDMIAYDDTGEFLFIPHETLIGAGVSRHDIEYRSTEVIFEGDGKGLEGDWSNDYGAFDPCRYTPNGTLFLGEEWSGEGRIIEVINPFDNTEDIIARELHSIANVSHEGINFSEKYARVIYFVDEYNSGSIYKFVMTRPGNYTKGQTFVLKVDDFDGDATLNWNDAANENAPRTGMAEWAPITDRNGRPLQGISDPFEGSASPFYRGGRAAADDVGGTPYGRPEDMEVGTLANNNEVLYIAVTSEKKVYTIEILSKKAARVGVLLSADTTKNVGFAETTGELNSPDNLAQDALGNIYIIEDAPNGSDIGGDVWFARDIDNDGVAESMDHFLSLQVAGSEATGMIFNPEVPTEFVLAVQHPTSTDLGLIENGLGDSVWKFDISLIENRAFVKDLERANWKKRFKKFFAGWW
ncbi:DUF839 domain-containing protein [Puniceicoccaceae bacterium K14]|nr:DUF839 domain-containing protein [Puniceicoccaceae bacterium K14]